MMPEGLAFVGSWVSADLGRCFQLMECDDVTLLQRWVVEWSELIDFEIVPGGRQGHRDRATGVGRYASGFSQRNPENRAKSPSVEHKVSPCSIARAARWASATSAALVAAPRSNAPRISRCRSVGSGIQPA